MVSGKSKLLFWQTAIVGTIYASTNRATLLITKFIMSVISNSDYKIIYLYKRSNSHEETCFNVIESSS